MLFDPAEKFRWIKILIDNANFEIAKIWLQVLYSSVLLFILLVQINSKLEIFWASIDIVSTKY